MCGFDHASFASLHAKFKIDFDKYTPYSRDGRIRKLPTQHHGKRRGRPRLLSSVQSLGLALAWTRTQGSYAVLQVIFGLTPGQLSLWLRFSRRLAVKVLRHDPLAKVTVPTDLEIRNFETAIDAKYPAFLSNCWGPWMASSLDLKELATSGSRTCFIMDGHMITTYQICSFSLQMGRFAHATLMLLALCMTQPRQT